ncbi:lysine 2,3-aminomutase [Acidobacteria bacterium Mor1]|nr:lysine 2,3-aminomutase [Acidobacteria bacterium Mor1]
MDHLNRTSASLTGDKTPPRFKVFMARHLDGLDVLKRLPEETVFEMKVVASVLPFRVNEYVINHLIDWDAVPNDPIYQLTFPQRGMLSEEAFERMAALHRADAPRDEIQRLAQELRADLNPHPAGQMELNMPRDEDGDVLDGMQHKYNETVLFFPSQGQTCHAFCTFCFRWAQFVGQQELRMASTEAGALHGYLESRKEVSDLLVTGGDPMVMKTAKLAGYLEPLLSERFEHVQTIRIGTKALTYWPHRFVFDDDADDMLRLFDTLVEEGKHVSVMAHFNHWRELESPVTREAIRRIRDTGAQIRAQGPLLAHINDDASVWARMWETQVKLGVVPYYMFVERDTGARHYFEVPLERAWHIYRDAIQQVSGLARTVRGPSMSAGPGKVEVQGVTEIAGEKVFALRFLQGRNADWVHRPFYAKYDPKATWLDHLKPAFGESRFFFEEEYATMQNPRLA